MELLILIIVGLAIAITAIYLREDKFKDDFAWLDFEEKIDTDEEVKPKKKAAKKKAPAKKAAKKKPAKKAAKKRR